jgi:hypothetical protein
VYEALTLYVNLSMASAVFSLYAPSVGPCIPQGSGFSTGWVTKYYSVPASSLPALISWDAVNGAVTVASPPAINVSRLALASSDCFVDPTDPNSATQVVLFSPPPSPLPPPRPPSPSPPPISASQCYQAYNWVNDWTRQVDQGSLYQQCDSGVWGNSNAWYRFGDGNYKYIPWWNTGRYHCGTSATGWLNGRYPRISEGVISGQQICYSWDSACQWANYVSIVQCSVNGDDFFLFRFEQGTPACTLRVCTTQSVPAQYGQL